MVGNWDLYSNQWVLGGQNIAAGSYVSFTIQEGVVKDTYVIRDLILNGMELEVYYNPEDGSMNIPLGGFVGMSTNGLYACYLCATNMTTGSVKSTMVTGTISEDYNTITLKGFEAGFGLGIIGKDGSSLASFSDLYYATGSEITFKKQPAGNRAMDRYFVSGKRRNFRTIGFSIRRNDFSFFRALISSKRSYMNLSIIRL